MTPDSKLSGAFRDRPESRHRCRHAGDRGRWSDVRSASLQAQPVPEMATPHDSGQTGHDSPRGTGGDPGARRARARPDPVRLSGASRSGTSRRSRPWPRPSLNLGANLGGPAAFAFVASPGDDGAFACWPTTSHNDADGSGSRRRPATRSARVSSSRARDARSGSSRHPGAARRRHAARRALRSLAV
jgi:hypothetical protein